MKFKSFIFNVLKFNNNNNNNNRHVTMRHISSSLSSSSSSIPSTASLNIPSIIENKHLLQCLPYINGKFHEQKYNKYFNVYNPMDSSLIGTLPSLDVNDTNNVCDIAMKSWKSYKQTTGIERSKYLMKMCNLMDKYSNDLASIITLESGKPFNEAKGEVAYAKSFFEFYAEEAKRVKGEILTSPVPGRKLITL